MSLKKFVVSLSSMILLLNTVSFAVSEADNNIQEISNDTVEAVEKNSDEEFSVFGIFNKSFYENIIKCSKNIRDNAETALKSLGKIEEVVKKDNNGENNVMSDELKEKFKEFLIEQNKLDGSTTELLKILGLFADDDIVESESSKI